MEGPATDLVSFRSPWRRRLANVFIVVMLVLVAIDTLPSFGQFHLRLKRWVDPVLDSAGLWQETWDLFAPEPDKENNRVSATFSYEDGTKEEWSSPDWAEKSWLYKTRHFREEEFYDRVRRDNNGTLWGDFALWAARNHATGVEEHGPVTQIELTRHWQTIPPPPEPEKEAGSGTEAAGGGKRAEGIWRSFTFYKKKTS